MIQQLYHNPDIYQIHVDLPDNPLKYLNSYVVKGPTRHLVIDTGFNRPECQAALCGGLRELDVDLSRTDLFLTHLHGDHSGLVGLFTAAGCPVYMNEIDYTYLCDEYAGQAWQFIEDTYMKEGMPPEDIKSQFTNQARRYSPRIDFPIHAVADGDVVRLADIDFHIIHTPGHTKGICCLYLPEQEIFFTSDHILFDITPNIQVWPNMSDSLDHYLESLEKVRSLPVKLALPGHRKGNTSIVGRIDEIKEHHRRRLNEVLSIAAARPGSTAYDIAPHMTWSMRGKKWHEFPPTQKWFAMGETLAHIEYLLHHGQLRREEQGGLFRYYPV
ncbi:MBL fold hydrolase [Megasphaera sp. ASD88]|uniref:MBL fold metallo-hydrolase n=1 Tax=Megasphaera sp. ASD88 TaxID=2027407 RepID=UPI000BAB65EA|nr:MBL fold metallo-hydrolase [Megasphaera sp. ASD88]PAV39785.1 MBL fold hydrolase [Megasphaera sp. ASD88]